MKILKRSVENESLAPERQDGPRQLPRCKPKVWKHFHMCLQNEASGSIVWIHIEVCNACSCYLSSCGLLVRLELLKAKSYPEVLHTHSQQTIELGATHAAGRGGKQGETCISPKKFTNKWMKSIPMKDSPAPEIPLQGWIRTCTSN